MQAQVAAPEGESAPLGRRQGSSPALVLASYFVVFILLSLRWIAAMAHAIPASRDIVFVYGDDARLHVWILAWVAHALATDPAHILDANINYPAPAQLTGSEHFATSQLVFGPLYALTGNPVLAANLLIFLSYPLAAFAMQRLLVRLDCGRGPAWVGGLLFALGPLRVPANMQLPQYFNLFLPLAALALIRLRDRPEPRAALGLALVFVTGCFSSYYMAVLLCLVGGLWAATELTRDRPARLRFVVLAALAVVAVLAALALVSRPYFGRPEETGPSGLLRGWSERNFRTPFGWLAMLRLIWMMQFGDVQLVLALLGAAALLVPRQPAARRVAALGVLFALVGGVFMLMPRPLADLIIASPARFFRAPWRFAVVLGFGTSLLAAAALETARVSFRPLVATALSVVAALAVVLDLGIAQVAMTLDRISPLSNERPVYDAIGTAVRERGGGPILELPLIDWHSRSRADDGRKFVPHSSLEPDAMLGSTRHWLPILTGHTGYAPPHRTALVHAIERLPGQQALDDIVDMTHVRWLLLRPPDFWSRPRLRSDLLALSGVKQVLSKDGWILAEVERTPEHPEWFRSIAAGAFRPGYTALGMPLVALPRLTAIARVSVADAPERVSPGRRIRLLVTIENAGTNGWPAAIPGDAAARYAVGLVARWRALDGGPLDPAVPAAAQTAPAGGQKRPRPPARTRVIERFPLRRDVPAGESLVQDIIVKAPTRPGVYELKVSVRQSAGARFTRRGNVPLRLRVAVDA
jgi:hypothetical protein